MFLTERADIVHLVLYAGRGSHNVLPEIMLTLIVVRSHPLEVTNTIVMLDPIDMVNSL